MARDRSLARRVAIGAAASAAVAALVSALATSMLAMGLLDREEEERLTLAAATVADELSERGRDGQPLGALDELVRGELAESHQPGLLYEVLDVDGGVLAGEASLGQPPPGSCDHASLVHRCRVTTSSRLTVVTAVPEGPVRTLLSVAAVLVTLAMGALAGLIGRPLANWLMAPLLRLRTRVSLMSMQQGAPALGPEEGLIEVDELRHTIEGLVARGNVAIEQAQRFAANAAHELRTPLTAVRAELDLLLEGQTERTPVLPLLRAKVEELSTLVEHLLILAVPLGQGLSKEAVSIRDVLEDAVGELPLAQRARIQLGSGDAHLKADGVLLAALVSNAIGNALKFAGSVVVDVTVRDGAAVIAAFQDDGPGLAEEEREKVFEAFHRGPQAGAQRVPGHGLGLALVRHIARSHGGDAQFVAPVPAGRGARLEVRLPLSAADASRPS